MSDWDPRPDTNWAERWIALSFAVAIIVTVVLAARGLL